MSLSSWFPWRIARQHKGRSRPAHSPKLRPRTRLAVEQLEDRTVPSTYPVADVGQLIAAINTANSTPVADTIELAAGTTFTLTQVNNSTNGSNGLPVIAAAGGPLTILGNGDTIERSPASGTPSFRLFNVAAGASLTLANVTLQGGVVPSFSLGGAIRNQGTLDLIGVTVQNSSGNTGGGIYSSGSLTLEAGTVIRNNSARGIACGGGVYVAGGTATLTDVILSSNSARGASSNITAAAGFAAGGGLYVAAGTVTLTNCTLSSNSAVGGSARFPTRQSGNGHGGGLYVAAGTVELTNCTMSSNSAVGGSGNFYYSMGVSGAGRGGGLYVAGGTVTLTNVTLSSNSAVAGLIISGPHSLIGGAWGGGLYAAGGTVTLRNDTVTGNVAKDPNGKTRAVHGGGIYIISAATVYLDVFTLNHTTQNQPTNIDGSYTLL